MLRYLPLLIGILANAHLLMGQRESQKTPFLDDGFEVDLIDHSVTVAALADSLPPAINCPPNVTLQLAPSKCDTVFDYTVVAYDNLPGFVLTQTAGLPSGSAFPVGNTLNRFRVTDAAGNTATCSFRVQVLNYQANISCKDLFTMSLGTDCDTLLNAAQCLGGPPATWGCTDAYIVETNRNNTWTAPPTITAADLGKTIRFRVRDPQYGSSCWGYVQVRDLLPPVMTCADLTVSCIVNNMSGAFLRDSLGLAQAVPTVSDNCSSNVTLSAIDTWQSFPCDSSFRSILFRDWRATDGTNSATCLQTIRINRASIADIHYPAPDTLSCSNPFDEPSVTGFPYITVGNRNFNVNSNACNVNATHNDRYVQICDGSLRLERKWYVTDGCSSMVDSAIQHIFILDQTKPTVTCPANVMVAATSANCTANVALPEAVVADACSYLNHAQATWSKNGQLETLSGQLSNFNGNNPSINDTLLVFGMANGFPVGLTTVTYAATDDCGNVGTCSFQIEVKDGVAPVVVCKTSVVAKVDATGAVTVAAALLDNGSSDACNPVHFKAQRLNSSTCQANTDWTDEIKFCCEDISVTIPVLLRVYDIQVPAGAVNAAFGQGQSSTCTVNVAVQDTFPLRCVAPPDVSVACGQFDATLQSYMAGYSQTCQAAVVNTDLNYDQFDPLCPEGTIVRTFTVTAFNGQNKQCTQRITVNYEQNYAVRFPNDLIVTSCAATPTYGEPVIYGQDCERMVISFEDQKFTVVPDACYKIERTWTIYNQCTYNAAQPKVYVPNPNPNATNNHPDNLPGPTVSPSGTHAPWVPTVVKISPTDPTPTNYSVFWSANANGYQYKQIIKVLDTQDPVIDSCTTTMVIIKDNSTGNDPALWNAVLNSLPNDLCETPVDLSVTASDACKETDILIGYLLYMDLDNDGSYETIVKSQSPQTPGQINYNNYNTPSFAGGTPILFDKRNISNGNKYRFAVQKTYQNDKVTAKIMWNTENQPNTFVKPQLPYVRIKAQWFVLDICGNQSTCTSLYKLEDGPPNIQCANALTVPISTVAAVQVTLNEVVLAASDGCTPDSSLQVSLRKAGTGTGFPLMNGQPLTNLYFNCFEVGTHTVEAWVKDGQNKTSTCTTTVTITDDNALCQNTDYLNAGGKIATPTNDGVPNTTLSLDLAVAPNVPPINVQALSDTSGNYFFANNVVNGASYTLTPSKNNDPQNGVSTFDLLLISKHILGAQPFTTPYQMIAADINQSGTISTYDIVEARKLILGITTTLPNGKSWRFFPKNYVFPNPANPFSPAFPESITRNAVLTDQVMEDFTAIKIGDVNGSATTDSLLSADDRDNPVLYFEIQDKEFAQNDTVEVHVQPKEDAESWQFTLHYQGLELLNVQADDAQYPCYFGLFPNDSALTVSATNIAASTGFTMKFVANRLGTLANSLAVSSQITAMEAYVLNASGALAQRQIQLSFVPIPAVLSTSQPLTLLQSLPNPANDVIQVQCYLPQASRLSLRLTNQLGQQVWSSSQWQAGGTQTLLVPCATLPNGVYWLDLTTDRQRVSGKVMVKR